jgi:hypothetical protein
MLKTKTFGHHKARKNIVKNLIPVQGVMFFGDTLEESAAATLIAEAVQGRGPISKLLKAESKTLADKFAKANPDFKFSRFGRNRKPKVEAPAPSTKASKAKSKKKKELATA